LSASSVVTITTGSVSTASVSEDQMTAGRPHTGSPGSVDDVVDPAADEHHEEAQAEEAEDDRGNASEVLHRGAHVAGDARAARRVLGEVDARGDADRHARDRHQQGEEHGAVDRREDAAAQVRSDAGAS
jgi:hypothetical protein